MAVLIELQSLLFSGHIDFLKTHLGMPFFLPKIHHEKADAGDICRRAVVRSCMGSRMMRWAVLVFAFVSVIVDRPVVGQVSGQVIDKVREYNVKAVSLYAFSRLTVWPRSAFSDVDSDLVIGVYGASRIRSPLEAVAQKKTVGNRKLRVVQCEAPDDSAKCHLVFVSGTIDFEQQTAIIKATEKLPVFVVGESPGFGAAAGVANFFISGTNVKFELNQVAAEAKGLKLNAKLLSLGTEVKTSTAYKSDKIIR